MSYSYDPFGNIQRSGNWSFQEPYTTANKLSGWTYDAAGDIPYELMVNPFTYDANGMISAWAGGAANGGIGYVYDAAGNRVAKTGGTALDTIYFGGRPLARLAGGAWTDLIYGVNGLLAETPGTEYGASVYRMTDHLGTLVGTLSSTGVVLSAEDFAPFGQLFTGGTTDPFQFTGKERDTESGNDYFGARYYASSMGRFMSPDPSGLLAQNPADPQSWNLYAYARNNPLILIDPNGLDCVYANDAGNGVESIDHNSNSGECGQNGGSWAPGYVDENWANYNAKTEMFQVGSINGAGDSATVDYTMFSAGAQTQWNGDESSCTGGCSGFASANANWLQGQLVGNSMGSGLDGYIQFLVDRTTPVSGAWQVIAGPLDASSDHWAGPNGAEPPGGTGDWRASVHDFNFNQNGPNGVLDAKGNGITIGMYFNPTLSPVTSKALIQSNQQLMKTGGFQGAKEKGFFGIVNAFQWYSNSWK